MIEAGTHFVNPSMTEFIELESRDAVTVIDPCSTGVTIKESALSPAAGLWRLIYILWIDCVQWEVNEMSKLALTVSNISSTNPTAL